MSDILAADAPIGVFDSGIGGLSVLQHIRSRLPHENLLYFADSGFAPYGDKPEEMVAARSLGIAQFFMEQRIKALVVACNTATAAAINAIRAAYPALPVVGVEPGLKPGAAMTRTGVVGVLATARTLRSARFEALREQIATATGVRFEAQACVGLADQVEKGELHSAATALLVRQYLAPLVDEGVDTLILGCTHYPFLRRLIEEVLASLTAKPMTILDTGDAVARRLAGLLEERGVCRTNPVEGCVSSFTTGSETALATAFARLLALSPTVARVG